MQLENELVAITMRSPMIEQATQEWLYKHFRGKIQEVKFARNIYIGEQRRKTKADFCREAGIQVMIECSIETARDCASNGIPTILLDKPWNQGPLPPGVTIVHSGSEIPAAIKTILK